MPACHCLDRSEISRTQIKMSDSLPECIPNPGLQSSDLLGGYTCRWLSKEHRYRLHFVMYICSSG